MRDFARVMEKKLEKIRFHHQNAAHPLLNRHNIIYFIFLLSAIQTTTQGRFARHKFESECENAVKFPFVSMSFFSLQFQACGTIFYSFAAACAVVVVFGIGFFCRSHISYSLVKSIRKNLLNHKTMIELLNNHLEILYSHCAFGFYLCIILSLSPSFSLFLLFCRCFSVAIITATNRISIWYEFNDNTGYKNQNPNCWNRIALYRPMNNV